MPNKSGKLFLFEALELLKEYDKHIDLLKELLEKNSMELTEGNSYRVRESAHINYEKKFDAKKIKNKLNELENKKLFLNQEIQMANFKTKIDYEGENISLSSALNKKESLNLKITYLRKMLFITGFKVIVYKEGRDVVFESKYSFENIYNQYNEHKNRIKKLTNDIHNASHKNIVNIKKP